MSQSMINFRMDSDLKKRMEETCKRVDNDGSIYDVCNKGYK